MHGFLGCYSGKTRIINLNINHNNNNDNNNSNNNNDNANNKKTSLFHSNFPRSSNCPGTGCPGASKGKLLEAGLGRVEGALHRWVTWVTIMQSTSRTRKIEPFIWAKSRIQIRYKMIWHHLTKVPIWVPFKLRTLFFSERKPMMTCGTPIWRNLCG